MIFFFQNMTLISHCCDYSHYVSFYSGNFDFFSKKKNNKKKDCLRLLISFLLFLKNMTFYSYLNFWLYFCNFILILYCYKFILVILNFWLYSRNFDLSFCNSLDLSLFSYFWLSKQSQINLIFLQLYSFCLKFLTLFS